MKQRKVFTTALATLMATGLFTVNVAHAATVEVTFDESKRYTDIRPAQGRSRAHFKKEVFANLTKYYVEQGEKLPAEQSLSIKVTNIDLAGEVLLTGAQETRIVRDAYIPRLEFTFELKDEQGKVIKSGEANIKDMNFMRRLNYHRMNATVALPAEQALIQDWFKETFEL